jgi:hypothetical protein
MIIILAEIKNEVLMASELDGSYNLYVLTAKRFTTKGKSRIEFLKIGHAKNVKSRFKSINFSTPLDVRILATISFPSKKNLLDAENLFKKRFKSERIKGEWFIVYENKMIENYYLDFLKSLGMEIKIWE